MKHILLTALIFASLLTHAQTPYLDTSANIKGRVSADINPISVPFLSGSVSISKIVLSPISINGGFATGYWGAYYYTGGTWQPMVYQQYSVSVDYTKTLYQDMALLFTYISTMTLDNGLRLNITYK